MHVYLNYYLKIPELYKKNFHLPNIKKNSVLLDIRTMKALSEPKLETKLEIKVEKKKSKKLRKGFDEFRHTFSKYRKAFCIAKNYKNLSELEKTNKSFNKLKKSLGSKHFRDNINSVDYEDLDNYDDNYDFADDDKFRKIGAIRTLFKEFDRDYYKPNQ